MNPILINPKIESDKSTGEQLQQMKSYLYQFKEQIELLLMNIDTDNVSAKFKEDITDFVGNKIMNGKEMSEIMQSAGMIKLSVADLESSVAAVTITANGVYAQVNGANGILSRLDVDENGIAASVKKGTQYSGITLSGSGVQINSTGTFTVDTTHFTLDSAGNLWCNSGTFEGEVIANSGEIAGFKIKQDGLYIGNIGKALRAELDPHDGQLLVVGDDAHNSVRIPGIVQLGGSAGEVMEVETAVFIKEACYMYKLCQIDGTLILNSKISANSVTKTVFWEDIDNVTPGTYVLCGS